MPAAVKPQHIGGYQITRLYDGLYEAGIEVFTHSAGPGARRRALAGWSASKLQVDVNCYALARADGLTLIDAGTGEAWGPNFGHARLALRNAGFAPADVTRVLLTHIHGDHALGLLDGERDYFPHAEIWTPARELAFYTNPKARAAAPEPLLGVFAIADQLAAAYGGRVKSVADGNVLPSVEALPMPGHTPGHTGYLIRGEGEDLLLWGDLLHVGELQAPDPELGIIFDLAPETAAKSRRDILARASDEGWIVAGGHTSGFCRVLREGAGFRMTPA